MTPGDTFQFDISALNSTSTLNYLITPDETVRFGTTVTFKGAGINGQDITIISGETYNGSTTTDTFTVSTPTNFLDTPTVNGTLMTQMGFDLGNANAGGNTVDYLLTINGATGTGSVVYGATSNTQFTLDPALTLTNGGLSLAAVEGASTDGTTAISDLYIHQFTLSVTYPTAPVPEPSTLALLGGASVLGASFYLRRNRKETGPRKSRSSRPVSSCG